VSDRILRTALGAILLIGVLGGCSEQVTASLGCPALCVDESAALRDTILTGSIAIDTSIAGFPQLGDTRDLTMLNRGDTADVRLVARYDSLPMTYQIPAASSDSVIRFVDSATLIMLIDTLTTKVTSAITIDAFDVDTTANDTARAALIGLYRPGRLIGSQTFQPTDLLDTLRLPLNNDSLFAKIRDSLHLRIGLRIRSGQTKLKVLGTTFAPRIRIRVSTDTTVVPDTIYPVSQFPLNDTYLESALTFYNVVAAGSLPQPPNTQLVIGGLAGARTYLRFDLPTQLVDSVQVIRASLLLTQNRGRSTGATTDSIYVYVQPVLAAPTVTDIFTSMAFIGSPTAYGVDSVLFSPRDSGLKSLELVSLVSSWKGAGTINSTRAIVLRTPLEGLAAGELSFFSMEGPVALRPRLRITYVPRRGFGIP
jgi:hypothetical protein